MPRRKQTRRGALLLALLLALTGCGVSPGEGRLTQEETLYNGYLGLQFTVPDNWYLVDLNRDNLSETPQATASPDDMDFYEYYGESVADLLTIESESRSNLDDHAEFSIYVEDSLPYYPTMDDYTGSFIESYVGEWEDGYYCSFDMLDETFIDGVPFTRMAFTIDGEDGVDSVKEEYCLAIIEDMYLVIYYNYWADSRIGESMARSLLDENIVLTKTPAESSPEIGTPVSPGTYYNGYLNLVVLLPEDKVLVAISRANLTERPGQSEQLQELEREESGGGAFRIPLATIATQGAAAEADRAMLEFYAEGPAGFRLLGEYVEQYIQEHTGPVGETARAELLEQDDATVNGWHYRRLVVAVTDDAQGSAYTEEHYITQVGDLFFVANINYLEDSALSVAAAMEMLNGCFYFEEGEAEMEIPGAQPI